MTQRRLLWALLVLVSALALVAAGCGGSDSASEDGAAAAEATTEETMTDETSDDEMMTDETTAEEESDDTSGSLSGLVDKDCLELASIGASIAKAVDPTGSFDADEAADLYEQLAAKAPDEIKDDLAVFADYLAEIADALSGVDLTSGQAPSAEDLAALQALGNVSPEVEQAGENISAWAEENCGARG